MQRTVATLLVATLCFTSSPVSAAGLVRPGVPTAFASSAPADSDSFDALVSEASAKFSEKDYAAAVDLFERAYEVQNEPAILFNIGRIYEEAQNIEGAIAYYERFIADESVDQKDSEKAVQRLQTLRTILEIRNKAKGKDAPPPEKKPDPPAPAQPVVRPQPTPPPSTTDTKPNQGRLLRPLGATFLATGAGLLIGGAISGSLAKREHRAFTDAETLADRQTAAQRGCTRAVAADALFIVGGAFLATGIILLVLPAARKKPRAQALTPHVSPTHVGLGFTHRF